MPTHRVAAGAVPAAIAAALCFSLSACVNEGGLQSAGPTRAALGPVPLWPDLPPISAPPIDFGESDKERVPGVRVPDDDVHRVDPVAVVRAEARAQPENADSNAIDTDPTVLPGQTVAQLADCAVTPAACPVLRPYHHDLTGDGRDELIVGITLPDKQLAVRCYRAERGGLTRIMTTSDQITAVELANRDLIVRVVSAGIPGNEYRTTWSWNARQKVMLPAREEIIPTHSPSPSSPVSGPPEPAPAPVPGRTTAPAQASAHAHAPTQAQVSGPAATP
ncbi:hypothetical protein [Streptomyces sp. NPDC088725]|uniref:hypothetical protein n=1 Tax=Streptomyces sp. NPDC088725 TaxID=3365873 RepID=UPI00381AA7EA